MINAIILLLQNNTKSTMNILNSLLIAVLISLISLIGACNNKDQCEECTLEPDPGRCKAMFPKFYFDQDDKECKQFIWGGCEGVVPFDTMEDCEACKCK